jgi:hypothetical protein
LFRPPISVPCISQNELEVHLANEDRLQQEIGDLSKKLSQLEADSQKDRIQKLIAQPDGDMKTEDATAAAAFSRLTALWDQLGVPATERGNVALSIRDASVSVRNKAIADAELAVTKSQRQLSKLSSSLVTICEALGQPVDSFFASASASRRSADVNDNVNVASPDSPLLRRVDDVRTAADAATASMTVRSSDLEKLKEQLLDVMSEMWLEATELPPCLKCVLQVDFHAASVRANEMCSEDISASAATGHSTESGDEACAATATALCHEEAIASYMINSAVAIAEQLKVCSLTLRQEDLDKWTKELTKLNGATDANTLAL